MNMHMRIYALNISGIETIVEMQGKTDWSLKYQFPFL